MVMPTNRVQQAIDYTNAASSPDMMDRLRAMQMGRNIGQGLSGLPTVSMEEGGSIANTAQGIASLGRQGDNILVHMSPDELDTLSKLGNITYNPVTGLPEAFSLKKVFKAVRKVAPIALAIAAPYLGAAALGTTAAGLTTLQYAALTGLGSGVGSLIAGAKPKDALKAGIISGATAGLTKGIGQKMAGKSFFGPQSVTPEKTGLLLDPYFSSSKLSWILDNTDNARDLAESGQLLFGTIDTFILWKLTEGKVHATDATNAARTMLYDIEHSHWSEDLCEIFQIPMNILPEVKDCASSFGETSLFGTKIPILGMAGDQQAATLGQACFEPGMIKATYGTGCFALLNTGSSIVRSKNKMLTTIAYQLGGETTYALEGSIFVAGAAVQWLRDGLKLIESSDQTDNLALGADKNENIIFVPALTGIGAPYWNANCRGAIYGITRNTTEAEIALATLQSAGYQTRDLIGAMSADWKTQKITSLRVDGGMSASNITMQFMSDIVGIPVERPKILETTALGVAWLAGSYLDIYPDRKEFAKSWSVDKSYFPEMDLKTRDSFYRKWQLAIKSTLDFSDN